MQSWTEPFCNEESRLLLDEKPPLVKPILVLLFPFLTFAACSAWNAAGMTGCRSAGMTLALPEVLRESSGVAWSRSKPGVLLSHNDSGHDPIIYALDWQGGLVGEIPLRGARNRDWEDIATGECETGTCIYVADTGDNAEVRKRVVLYRLTDTGVYDGSPRTAEAFPMALPDGSRDIEALFVLPGEEVYFVTKGRSHPVTVYRYPPPLQAGVTVTLEAIQTLSETRLPIPQQITGADVSWDGEVVAIRSYQALEFYRLESGHLEALEGGRVDLRTLNERQGEGVGLGPGGEVALTSEAVLGKRAGLTKLTCAMATRDM